MGEKNKPKIKVWGLRVGMAAAVYVLVNAGLLLGWGLAWQGSVRSLKAGDVLEAVGQVKMADKLNSIFKITSLGLSRVPYVREVGSMFGSYLNLMKQINSLQPQVNELVKASLSGDSVEKQFYQTVFDHAAEVLEQAEGLSKVLDGPKVRELTGWMSVDSQINILNRRLSEVIGIGRVLIDRREEVLSMLGYEKRQHYIVLLQNNMELRPTGGYLGSYAEIWLNQGSLERVIIQDIGFPNGQIKGYVKEPVPLSKYLFEGGTPGWQLRDSNWQPDFPQAAEIMHWFFREGGLEQADGMLAINLIPVKEMLTSMGPITVGDYGISLTADNFYQTAQEAAEVGFFPGSTQKGDFLGAVGRQLLLMAQMGQVEPMVMANAIYHGLAEGQIMVAMFEPRLGEIFNVLGWDGALMPVECMAEDCFIDYWSLNEANLGINKTNCCVDREITDEIMINESGEVTHRLAVTYVNHNPPKPQPPESYGGGYKNYLRVIIPRDSVVQEVRVENEIVPMEQVDLEPMGDKVAVGFLVLVQGTMSGTATITYTLPNRFNWGKIADYELIVQKQSGVEILPVTTKLIVPNGWRVVVNQPESFSFDKLNQWRESTRIVMMLQGY